jgi:hypothetical protein
MKLYGTGTLSEFLEDRVVYRNLVPCDPRLPALADYQEHIGLPVGTIPRKTEPAYARAMAHVLGVAQARAAPEQPIEQLIFVGDTRLNDGTAFANLCEAGSWPGLAFIGSETAEALQMKVENLGQDRTIYMANRWSALAPAPFAQFCEEHSAPVGPGTAVIVDLDKTALGARGRNAQVIDQARVEAVRQTVAEMLGPSFDQAQFQTAYNRLNHVEFHPFTGDNQDYLAYLSLVLGAGVFKLDSIVRAVKENELKTFRDFIAGVDLRRRRLPAHLGEIHAEVYQRVKEGDPTPFKAFRRNEYQTTIARFAHLPDETSLEILLEEEIVITQEVREQALAWKAQGALLFGLSDKPDEASIPDPVLEAQGYKAIHQAEMHIVGE